MSGAGGRRWAATIACGLVLLGAAWGWQHWQVVQQRARGAALFHGERPITGRLQGHAQRLPALAVRCANCHEALSAAPSGVAAAGAGAGTSSPYAGLLTGTALTTMRPRRGGPPSAYDAQRLCALLRTGIDPAQVMIPGTMPRYDLTADDCADLWAYLRDEAP